MLSHINSYKRDKLNNRSACQLFSFIYGESILNKLNVRDLQPNDIVLSPEIIEKVKTLKGFPTNQEHLCLFC